jgi:hypothetical protein
LPMLLQFGPLHAPRTYPARATLSKVVAGVGR